jgi:hypothetical protein
MFRPALAAAAALVTTFAMGCSGDIPTATGSSEPNFAVAGNSGCYTVKFTTESDPDPAFPVFSGEQSGDLVGTHTFVFTEFPPQTGATRLFRGVGTFWVTGGIISELVGKSFTVSVESRNVFNDPAVFANLNVKLRATGGVKKANLTGRGETSLPPAFLVSGSWNGVICP